MANVALSELITKTGADTSDLLEVAAVDQNSASGYVSRKESLAVIAQGVVGSFAYPTQMPTMPNRSIAGAINALLANFAPVYDSTETYAVGDVVTYNGTLYKCNTAIGTAETFDPSKWDAGTCVDFFSGGGGGGSIAVQRMALSTNTIEEVSE